jgi:hypothetical protein
MNQLQSQQDEEAEPHQQNFESYKVDEQIDQQCFVIIVLELQGLFESMGYRDIDVQFVYA